MAQEQLARQRRVISASDTVSVGRYVLIGIGTSGATRSLKFLLQIILVAVQPENPASALRYRHVFFIIILINIVIVKLVFPNFLKS